MPDGRPHAGFSIEAEPGMAPRVLLQPVHPGSAPVLFEETALRRHIAAARTAGRDTATGEAALAALRRVVAARAALAQAPLAVASDAPWRASVLAAAAEASREALMLATAGAMARIVYANPAFGRLAGAPPERLLGQDATTLLPGLDQGAAQTLGLRRVDGGTAGVHAQPFALHPAAGTGTAGHVAWVLCPVADEPTLDPLTGLPKPAAVEAALAAAMLAASPLRHPRGPCAAWLRMDGRREAGRQGAAVRDALIIGVAGRLSENLRRIDMLAYAGAGAFALCLPRVSLLEARAIVARLRVAVAAAPFETPAGSLPLRLRSGIAMAPSADPRALLDAARQAVGSTRTGGEVVA